MVRNKLSGWKLSKFPWIQNRKILSVILRCCISSMRMPKCSKLQSFAAVCGVASLSDNHDAAAKPSHTGAEKVYGHAHGFCRYKWGWAEHSPGRLFHCGTARNKCCKCSAKKQGQAEPDKFWPAAEQSCTWWGKESIQICPAFTFHLFSAPTRLLILVRQPSLFRGHWACWVCPTAVWWAAPLREHRVWWNMVCFG